jgi:hypothetical protein
MINDEVVVKCISKNAHQHFGSAPWGLPGIVAQLFDCSNVPFMPPMRKCVSYMPTAPGAMPAKFHSMVMSPGVGPRVSKSMSAISTAPLVARLADAEGDFRVVDVAGATRVHDYKDGPELASNFDIDRPFDRVGDDVVAVVEVSYFVWSDRVEEALHAVRLVSDSVTEATEVHG